jgi:hypothetical protein
MGSDSGGGMQLGMAGGGMVGPAMMLPASMVAGMFQNGGMQGRRVMHAWSPAPV